MRVVNEMAGQSAKPVVDVSALSVGFTNYTKMLRKTLPNIAVMQSTDRAVGAIKQFIGYAKLRENVRM